MQQNIGAETQKLHLWQLVFIQTAVVELKTPELTLIVFQIEQRINLIVVVVVYSSAASE